MVTCSAIVRGGGKMLMHSLNVKKQDKCIMPIASPLDTVDNSKGIGVN